MPCDMLRSATQTGLNSIAQMQKKVKLNQGLNQRDLSQRAF